MLHGLLQGKMDSAQEFWTIDPEGSPMFVRVVSQPDSGRTLFVPVAALKCQAGCGIPKLVGV